MTVTGPDVSSNQPHPIDWKQVKTAGMHDLAIVKASEGGTYVNPYLAADVAGARAAAISYVSAYHWVSPNTPAPMQVRNYLQQIRPLFAPGALVWLDFEENGATHALLDQVADGVEAAGYQVGVYTYPYFWAQNGDPNCPHCPKRPLWWANYSPPYVLAAPAPWSQVTLRQTHGTSYVVPGIGGLQDMSRAEVDLSVLLGKTSGPTAPTTPHLPTEEPDVARLISEDGKAIFGTDGVRAYHLPNPTVLGFLKATGVYGDGKVWPVPAGTVADLMAAEK